MFVLRKTMDAALEVERAAHRADMVAVASRYGAALSASAALQQVMSAWVRNDPGDITPEKAADMFYAQDDDWQAAFFNVMQARVVVFHDSLPPARPGSLRASPGYPAGEGQWYHFTAKLDDSGKETLRAMAEHLDFHENPERLNP